MSPRGPSADRPLPHGSYARRMHVDVMLTPQPLQRMDGTARALRDAGFEVVYTGLHQTPAQIVDAAIQEDADIIGLSVLSGAHLTLFAEVMDLLKAKDATDIVVFGGGIIPEDDIPVLEGMGVARIFTPGTPTHEIVQWVTDNVAR